MKIIFWRLHDRCSIAFFQLIGCSLAYVILLHNELRENIFRLSATEYFLTKTFTLQMRL